MGIFSGFKNTLAKSQAAVVIQNVLEKHQDLTGLSESPAAIANKMIEVSWNSAPELFNGRLSGKRAHKVSIAAHALAAAAYGANKKGNEQFEAAFALGLGEVLRAVESSPQTFEFSEIDHRLLGGAKTVFTELADDPKHGEVDELFAGDT